MNATLDTSSLLGRSIEVLGSNALPFLTVALVVQTPQLVLVARGSGALGDPQGDASFLAILTLLLPLLILTQIQAGLVAPGVVRALGAEKVQLRHCLPRDGSTLAAILAAAILVALAAACGFLFFLLPGWVVLTGFFVALPAVAIERLSPAAALGASWRLTARNWLSIFALVFMFTVLERLLSLALIWAGAPPLVSALPAIPISALQAVSAAVAFLRLRGPEPMRSASFPPDSPNSPAPPAQEAR